MPDFRGFWDEYDSLTDAVTTAHHTYLPQRLMDWFLHLEKTLEARLVVYRLENAVDYNKWLTAELQKAKSAGMGGSPLAFPSDKDQALGLNIRLFRDIAAGKMEAYRLGRQFVYSPGDTVELTNNVVTQLYTPFTRELRKFLEKEMEASTASQASVPAADRTVPITHNSPEYIAAIEALDRLEHTLRTANDFGDVEERDQRVAEVRATRTLMEAVRVRINAVVELLRPLATQFATKLKDSLVGVAVNGVIGALKALLKALTF